MDRNINRGASILMKIARHQESISEAMKRFGYKTEKDILKDRMVLDLGSFYLAQIGELAKNLTEQSKSSLTFMDASVLRTLRNVISHTYQSTDKTMLAGYIVNCQRTEAKLEVITQINYCKNEVKKEKSVDDKKPHSRGR